MNYTDFCAHLILLNFTAFGNCKESYRFNAAGLIPYNMLVWIDIDNRAESDYEIIVYYDELHPDPIKWSHEKTYLAFDKAWEFIFNFCKEHPGE